VTIHAFLTLVLRYIPRGNSTERNMKMRGIAKIFALGLGLIAGLTCSIARADGCVRSTPTPIFAPYRTDVQAHSFTLQSDHEAVERFNLGTNTQVKVEHGGCEYFVTKVRFESPDLFREKYTDAVAHQIAASLLQALRQYRPELNFDLDLASKTLLQEINRDPMPKLEQEFPIQGDGIPPIQARLLINAAGRDGSFGYLEITMFRGPL
jgi:hypothetical protein